MFNLLKITLLVLSVHFCALCLGKERIDPNEAIKSQININKELLILEDSSAQLTIDDILNNNYLGTFRSLKVKTGRRTYWGKLSFYNSYDRVSAYFLYVGQNDLIDTYYVRDGKLVHQAKSGYLYPSEEKEIERGSYYVPLYFGPKSRMDVYIRIQEKIHSTPEFDIKIFTRNQWTAQLIDSNIFDFLFQGFIWVIIIYNFFMFGATRIKGFVFYNVYLFFVSISFFFLSGILREYIISSQPWLTIYFMPSISLTFAAYWFFVLDFLNMKEKFPQFLKSCRWLSIGNIAISFLILCLIAFTNDINYSTRTMQITVLVNAFISLYLIYHIYLSKFELVKYYIGGTIAVVLFSIIEALLWNADKSSGVLVKYGILAEIVVFTMGLTKIKNLRQEEKKHAIDKQINQLKVNESLAKWQKEELEKIIDSRTEKIKRKNVILKSAIIKAEEAARVKSEFLSVMSHEIRTPMNAVIGMIHLLLNEGPKKSQLENLKTLKFSAENLLVLINDILDYSKVESGKVKLESIPFDIRELTKSIGHSHELKADEKGIKFNILIDQKIPSALIGDPARITQVLNNLISNAIKFTPQGQVKLLINLVNRINGKVNIEFSIEDTGIGISQDKLDLIFESFTQAHTDTTRIYGGTGLGLAITKKLMSLFESQIFVESKKDNGSRFYFNLLLEVSEKSPIDVDIDQTTTLQEVKNKHILVVDDNQINLMMAKKFVEKWGMKCDVVESGKEALIAIFNTDYDLILMDLQMPVMDGYETAMTIRSVESADISNIPIIAVSADTYENVHIRIIEAGMDDFLSKPFNPNELLNLIHKYAISLDANDISH